MYGKKMISIFLILFLVLPGCYEPKEEKDTDVFYGIDIDHKSVPMFTLINENSTLDMSGNINRKFFLVIF